MRQNPVFLKVLGQVASFLRTRGYAQKNNVLRAERPDSVLVVELQPSATIFRGSVAVTLNLGVCNKEIARKMNEKSEKARPADCHWEERLGFLMPIRDDKWWPLANDAEGERAANEIIEGLERFGLPALEAVSSTAGLREHWESGASRGRSDGQREWYLRLLSKKE